MNHELDLLSPDLSRSTWQWYLAALGVRYSLLLPIVALVSLGSIAWVATRCKSSGLSAILVVLVPLPALVGLVSVFDGLIASLRVLSGEPGFRDYTEWCRQALAGLQVGIWLSLPGLIWAIAMLTWRALTPVPDA